MKSNLLCAEERIETQNRIHGGVQVRAGRVWGLNVRKGSKEKGRSDYKNLRSREHFRALTEKAYELVD